MVYMYIGVLSRIDFFEFKLCVCSMESFGVKINVFFKLQKVTSKNEPINMLLASVKPTEAGKTPINLFLETFCTYHKIMLCD